jgi:tRNA modification GTPase
MNMEGILFRLIDTAGIRETEQHIESLGIERSQQKIKEASIVLCLGDATDQNNLSETQKWTEDLSATYPDKKIMRLINKEDLSSAHGAKGISLSAKNGTGIEDLKSEMVKAVLGEMDLENDTIIANARHHEALLQTAEALEKANTGLHDGTTGDFIAMDIRQAMFHLGSITGDISTDDLLGNIFSKFCIGK